MDDAKKERSMTADGIRGPGELQMAPSVNHSQPDSSNGDELVSSVTLYRRRPRLLHGTVLPFLAVLYPSWLYAWLGVYGASDYPEAGLLALAAIGIAHVLTALSGYWSVHAHCWLTCSKVNINNNNTTEIKSLGVAGAGGQWIVSSITQWQVISVAIVTLLNTSVIKLSLQTCMSKCILSL